MENQRNISEFILLGLPYNQNKQIFCFVFFLFCYLVLLVGKLLLLFSIQCSPLFNQAMYYFLSQIPHRHLLYLQRYTQINWRSASWEKDYFLWFKCMLQVLILHFFGGTEIFILTAMAFDHYVAICKPLHYVIIMNRTRGNLLLAAWAGGAVHSFPQFFMAIGLPFFGRNKIDHYVCDIFPLLKIACTDTYITGVLVIAFSVALVTVAVLLFVSYGLILFTLNNHSAEGRHRAHSPCGPHITVAILFFVPVIFTYLRPPTTFPEDNVFALFCTIIAPMFNALIYTIRNAEMKNNLNKFSIKLCFQRKHTFKE